MYAQERIFPIENTRVQVGRIEGDLSENSFTRLPLALRITISLELEGSPGQAAPLIRISPLSLGIKSWRELAGRRWTFPAHPAMGLSDGQPIPIEPYGPATFSVGESHADIFCIVLEFGAMTDRQIQARMILVETPSPTSTAPVGELAAPLEIGSIRVIGDVMQTERPGTKAALRLAAPLITLEDFDATQQGRIVHLRLRPS